MKRFLVCLGLLAVGCNRSPSPQRVEVVRTAEPAISAVAVESQAEPIGEPIQPDRFVFSDDVGGRILARILPPSESVQLPADAQASPQPRRELPRLHSPDLPMSIGALGLPTLPAIRRGRVHPHLSFSTTALVDFQQEVDVPNRPELPVAVRIRTPSRDVNEPIELPPQAGYSPDRTPLTDPTAEFSTERAMSHPLPLRVCAGPVCPDRFAGAVSESRLGQGGVAGAGTRRSRSNAAQINHASSKKPRRHKANFAPPWLMCLLPDSNSRSGGLWLPKRGGQRPPLRQSEVRYRGLT